MVDIKQRIARGTITLPPIFRFSMLYSMSMTIFNTNKTTINILQFKLNVTFFGLSDIKKLNSFFCESTFLQVGNSIRIVLNRIINREFIILQAFTLIITKATLEIKFNMATVKQTLQSLCISFIIGIHICVDDTIITTIAKIVVAKVFFVPNKTRVRIA